MKHASPGARIAAFWLDALILVTSLLVAARVIWTVMPGSEVRESAMQLFTAKEFRVFFANAGAAIGLLFLYFRHVPAWFGGATPGQKLARVRMGRPDGSPLAPEDHRKRAGRVFTKFFLIFFGGPTLAAMGGNTALSVIALLSPVVFLLVLSALAWADPEGVGPEERSAGIRFFSTEP